MLPVGVVAVLAVAVAVATAVAAAACCRPSWCSRYVIM